jgi:hypothetical protein
METRQDTTIYAGQDVVLTFTLLDDEGAPILAEAVAGARWCLSDGAGACAVDADAVLVKYLGAGITVTDGVATVTIANADAVPAGTYYHELSLRDVDGKKYPVSAGLVYVRPSCAAGVV